MKTLITTGLRGVVAFAILAALTGCDQGKTYSMSPEAARSALAGTTIPDIAFGKSAHTAPGEATADGGVAWTIVLGSAEEGAPSADGDSSEVMKLAAKLTPASSGVEVSVDIEPRSGVDPKLLAKAMAQRPAVVRYFRTVAREQVDAVLTHRDFSFPAVSGDMALATVSMLPDIRKQMDEEAAAYERRDLDTVHRAYDLAAQGRR
jgi:hypothetical protein